MIAHCARNLLQPCHGIPSHAEKPTTGSEFIAHYAWNTSPIAQANRSVCRASRVETIDHRPIIEFLAYHTRKNSECVAYHAWKIRLSKGIKTSIRSPGQANLGSTETIQATKILLSSGIFNNSLLNLEKNSYSICTTCITDNNRTNPDLYAKTSAYLVLPQMTIVCSALEPGAPMLAPAPTPFLHARSIRPRYAAVQCETRPTYTRARSNGYTS